MTRTADAIEGLAVRGSATVAGRSYPVPALLRGRDEPEPSGVPSIPWGTGPEEGAGVRTFEVADGLRLRFEVPTPDLSAASGAVRRDGPVAYVRGPVSTAELEGLRAPARPELVVLSNARQLLREGRPFVATVGAIRESLGSLPVLWAPRVAVPNRIPLLVYLGIDWVDTTEARIQATEGHVSDAELGAVGADSSAGFCGCPPGAHASIEGRSAHAVGSLAHELGRARAALGTGRLRELVEARLPSEPLLAELLRYADLDLAERLEERTPVIGDRTAAYVLRESFRRPEAKRFRHRFLTRYAPPPSKEVLLLVPCSKTKPYRNSRSHRRFASAWDGLPRTERLHVVSVTSPLGVVPRELEDLPPARHYDIPVTGDWDEGERSAVIAGVRALLERGNYRRVIVHLDPGEYEYLRGALSDRPDAVWTMEDDRSTSEAALARLRSAAGSALESLGTSDQGALRTVKEELRGLAAVQLGPLAAGRLFAEPLRLHGRPWFQRISDGAGTDLATWREERGLFHLTFAGGVRVGTDAGLSVEVGEDFELKGDLFAPGVRRADPGIRVGDDVVLARSGAPIAVGEAVLPGPLMADLGRGLAVRVRHRGDGALPTNKTLDPTPLATVGRSSSG